MVRSSVMTLVIACTRPALSLQVGARPGVLGSRARSMAMSGMSKLNDQGVTYKVTKSDAEWQKELSREEFYILREKGTERPRTGQYDKFYPKEGHFVCAGCGTPLYSAAAKFDSGCGWPSFTKPVAPQVLEKEDRSHGMRRVEVRSKDADSHLGHVFDDGPREAGGLRYCINSASLRFIPLEQLDAEGYGEFRRLFV